MDVLSDNNNYEWANVWSLRWRVLSVDIFEDITTGCRVDIKFSYRS